MDKPASEKEAALSMTEKDAGYTGAGSKSYLEHELKKGNQIENTISVSHFSLTLHHDEPGLVCSFLAYLEFFRKERYREMVNRLTDPVFLGGGGAILSSSLFPLFIKGRKRFLFSDLRTPF